MFTLYRQFTQPARLAVVALLALSACSADEDPPPVAAPGQTLGGSRNPTGGQEQGELIAVVDDAAQDTSSTAPGLGSETLCDGLDENNNGIIDDVDVGRDGLCDCIRIGFFGQVSSDAGNETAAFATWLEERSDSPVERLAATATLTSAWLDNLQVLVVGGMQDRAAAGTGFSEAELAALDGWLQTVGGGIVTLAGYSDDPDDVAPTNQLISRLGIQYQTSGVPAAGVIGDGAPPIWLHGIAAPAHPTVEGIAEFGFYYGYPVTGEGTVVLADMGYDLALAREYGAGRAFIFGDEWITQDITWSGSVEGGNDECQQPCNEQNNICPIAEQQCAQCAMQPCSDPAETDPETCFKGCQPSCDNETQRCMDYTAQCQACSGDATAREQATPRLWLNTIRWLTPANECKVEIPTNIRVR